MKTAALLIFAALLAPVAFLAAHHANRRAWPAVAGLIILLGALLIGARIAP